MISLGATAVFTLAGCATPEAAAPDQCATWAAAPWTHTKPLVHKVNYALGLRFIDPATGAVVYAVETTLDARAEPPGNLEARLVDAAMAMIGAPRQ